MQKQIMSTRWCRTLHFWYLSHSKNVLVNTLLDAFLFQYHAYQHRLSSILQQDNVNMTQSPDSSWHKQQKEVLLQCQSGSFHSISLSWALRHRYSQTDHLAWDIYIANFYIFFILINILKKGKLYDNAKGEIRKILSSWNCDDEMSLSYKNNEADSDQMQWI